MKNYVRTIEKLNQLMEQGVFPGYSVALVEGEEVQKYFAGSMCSAEDAEPVRDGLWYDLASVTKAFVTSTLLVQMVERGEIDLDTPITHWFPDARGTQVTLRHLVTHTSGLWGYIENRDQLSADELIEALTKLPVSETFNTVKYTDTGFVLAGIILEKQLGKPVAELFEERIATPLGLSAQYGPLEKVACVPTAFDEKRGGLLCGVVHDPKASVLGKRCGSAGLFATLDDCLKLVQLYLKRGSVNDYQFCQEKSILYLQHDWTPTRNARRSLGWDLDYVDEQIWLRHTGFTGTTVLMNLQTQQALIVLTNRIHCFSDTPTYNQLREELIHIYEKEAGEVGC